MKSKMTKKRKLHTADDDDNATKTNNKNSRSINRRYKDSQCQ